MCACIMGQGETSQVTHERGAQDMSERQMAVKQAREMRAWEIVVRWEMRMRERAERGDVRRRAAIRRWWRTASRFDEWAVRGA